MQKKMFVALLISLDAISWLPATEIAHWSDW